jgi:hypothetical protein
LSIKGIDTHKQYIINHRINDNGLLERKCTLCEEWLVENLINFYLVNKSKPELGFTPRCRKCTIKKSHLYQVDHEKESKKIKIDWYKEHKELNWERANQWKEQDPEYALQCYREWQKSENGKLSSIKSREKRKPKEHVIYDIEWINTKKYFGDACAYCSLPIGEHWILYRGKTILGDLHKDHVIDDGRNDIKNSLPACESCNSSKHRKTLNEFYNPNNPNYTKERYLRIVEWLKGGYKPYILPKRRYKRQRMTARIKEVEQAKNKSKLKISS